MRIHNRNGFVWKNNKLYFQDELMMTIVPHKVYPDMFWLKWPDGVFSQDFYSLSRAKDNAERVIIKDLNENRGFHLEQDSEETP